MEYDRLDTLKSAPAQETTAVTLKSIKEILAETGQEGLLQASSAKEDVASAAVPQLQRPPVQPSALQRPPVPDAGPSQRPSLQPRRVERPDFPTLVQPVAPPLPEKEIAQEPAKKSFMSRLLGRG